MHYADGAFWRPLFETNMELLLVASGCSHNRCRFCNMYRNGFRVSPREEVEADLQELREFVATYPKQAYLLGYHVSNVVRLQGTLPNQAQQMLTYLDKAIADLAEDQMESFRSSLTSI
ncbi:MAG: hypothetical protein DUD33_05730 [Coriobacteriaceae bacterium]|nr:MAG: hypothetical protein DUD33_05730 [Coriobacteriaceae bacterium]